MGTKKISWKKWYSWLRDHRIWCLVWVLKIIVSSDSMAASKFWKVTLILKTHSSHGNVFQGNNKYTIKESKKSLTPNYAIKFFKCAHALFHTLC